jgi:RasGEF domain
VTKFNLTGAFFARAILIEKDVKQRAACLKKVIKIAHHSLLLQNYSSTMALVGSLESVNIRRLKHTWALLDRKTVDLYRNLAEVCSPTANYATLRKRVLEQTPPLIPYLGVFLSDLTYIHVGLPLLFGCVSALLVCVCVCVCVCVFFFLFLFSVARMLFVCLFVFVWSSRELAWVSTMETIHLHKHKRICSSSYCY